MAVTEDADLIAYAPYVMFMFTFTFMFTFLVNSSFYFHPFHLNHFVIPHKSCLPLHDRGQVRMRPNRFQNGPARAGELVSGIE